MKPKLAQGMLALVLLCLCGTSAQGQSTSFTYQGRLDESGAQANGSYDFQFALFNSVSNGNLIAAPFSQSPVTVSNGVFTVGLDFGNVFNGSALWLEIGVRTNGSPESYTTLTPRQPLTAAPYAVFAETASNLSGTVSGSSLAGAYANAVTFSNALGTFTGNINGNGSGLTNLSYGQINGGVLPPGVVTNNAAGLTLSGNFSGTVSGDGGGLTNLSYAQINGGVLPNGVLTNNANGVTLSGNFSGTVSGDGSLLTAIGATNLAGVAPSGVLAGPYTNNVTFSNALGNFTGKVSGDGAGLTNLSYAQINGGALPSSVVTNNAGGVTLSGTMSGTFSGDGSLLTSIGATNLVGVAPSGALAGPYTNNVAFSNASGNFTGKVSGDGSGLANLSYAQINGGLLPNTVVTNNETGITMSGAFSGTISGNGSGLTNLALPASVLTNNNVGATLFRGAVAFSNGLAANGNTVVLFSNTTAGGYTFISSNISALALTNLANGLVTNAVAIGTSSLGPQIVIPGIQGDQRMVRLLGREGNFLGLGGLVVETVQTNRQTYLDLWPSSTSATAMNTFSEVAWLDVVDRDLSQPGSDANWETVNIGMSGQGYVAPHGTVGTHAGGSGVVRDLWINGGNIEFFNGFANPVRLGQLFATSTGSGFALCDNVASNAVAQQFAGNVIFTNASAASPAAIIQLQFPTNSTIEYQYHFVANVVSNLPSTFYHMSYSGTVVLSQALTNSYTVDGIVTNLSTGNTPWSIVPTTNVSGVVWTFAGDGTNTVRVKYNIFASGGGQSGTFTY